MVPSVNWKYYSGATANQMQGCTLTPPTDEREKSIGGWFWIRKLDMHPIRDKENNPLVIDSWFGVPPAKSNEE